MTSNALPMCDIKRGCREARSVGDRQTCFGAPCVDGRWHVRMMRVKKKRRPLKSKYYSCATSDTIFIKHSAIMIVNYCIYNLNMTTSTFHSRAIIKRVLLRI